MLPHTAIIPRREPRRELMEYPDVANVRVPVEVYPQRAPDPIREGDFWHPGKPIAHAWAHAARWLSTSIDQWLSVEAWNGGGPRIAKYVRSNIVRVPLGTQAAFVERVNIARGESTPYGSSVELQASPSASLLDMRGFRPRG